MFDTVIMAFAIGVSPSAVRGTGTIAKLLSFLDLPDGWHYGSGSPPDSVRVQNAVGIIDLFASHGLVKTDAFPGIDGEVRITAYHNTSYLEVTLELDGTVCLVLEADGAEVIYKDRLSLWEAKILLDKTLVGMKQEECNSSDLSIQNTTTLLEESSKIWHFGTNEVLMGLQVCHASVRSVPLLQVEAYAPTLESTIPRLLMNPQYSGSLT